MTEYCNTPLGLSIIIFMVIIFTGLAFWFLVTRFRQAREDNNSDRLCYNLVWEEKFKGGEIDQLIWNVPELEGMFSDPAVPNEQGYYTAKTNNIILEEGEEFSFDVDDRIEDITTSEDDGDLVNLNLRTTTDTVTKEDVNGSRIYPYSTSKVITTASFVTGLFVFKFKFTGCPGVWPFIRLIPYANVTNNAIGSANIKDILENPNDVEFSKWPASGEIDVLDAVRYDSKNRLEWTGRIWFGSGGNDVPSRFAPLGSENDVQTLPSLRETAFLSTQKFPPLQQDMEYRIGLEWKLDKMVWYLDPRVGVDGQVCGKKLLEIPSSDWYSISPDGKKCPAPAPFDRLFHIVAGLSVGPNRHSRVIEEETGETVVIDDDCIGSLIFNRIKVYQLGDCC